MQEQGYRTTTETAQARSACCPAIRPVRPARFPCGASAGSEVNVLYNGIWTGPQDITSRVDGYGQSRPRGVSQRPVVADVRTECDRRVGQLRDAAADQRPDQERTGHSIDSLGTYPDAFRLGRQHGGGRPGLSRRHQPVAKLNSFIDGDYPKSHEFLDATELPGVQHVQGIRGRRVQKR